MNTEATDVRPDDMLPDVPALVDSDATRIVIVLDRSGSMSSCRESTVTAFNEFVRDQKKLPGEATLKLVQFDDQYEVVFDKPLQQVPELTQDTFVPRGGTALYDAQGKTIALLQEELNKMPSSKRPAKVVVVTLTDGGENSSKEYKQETVASLVQQMKDTYKWQFIYLGANQDAFAVGAAMNFASANVMNYATSNIGSTMRAVSSNLSSLRSMKAVSYNKLAPDEAEQIMAFTSEQRAKAVSNDQDATSADINNPFVSATTTTGKTDPITNAYVTGKDKDNA